MLFRSSNHDRERRQGRVVRVQPPNVSPGMGHCFPSIGTGIRRVRFLQLDGFNLATVKDINGEVYVVRAFLHMEFNGVTVTCTGGLHQKNICKLYTFLLVIYSVIHNYKIVEVKIK